MPCIRKDFHWDTGKKTMKNSDTLTLIITYPSTAYKADALYQIAESYVRLVNPIKHVYFIR